MLPHDCKCHTLTRHVLLLLLLLLTSRALPLKWRTTLLVSVCVIVAYTVVHVQQLQHTLMQFGRPHTDALKRYQYDSDLAVFLQILEGKLPEALQHEEVLLLRRVLAACVALDKKQGHGGHCTGAVARKDFVEILRHQVRTYEYSLGALVCGGGVLSS